MELAIIGPNNAGKTTLVEVRAVWPARTWRGRTHVYIARMIIEICQISTVLDATLSRFALTALGQSLYQLGPAYIQFFFSIRIDESLADFVIVVLRLYPAPGAGQRNIQSRLHGYGMTLLQPFAWKRVLLQLVSIDTCNCKCSGAWFFVDLCMYLAVVNFHSAYSPCVGHLPRDQPQEVCQDACPPIPYYLARPRASDTVTVHACSACNCAWGGNSVLHAERHAAG